MKVPSPPPIDDILALLRNEFDDNGIYGKYENDTSEDDYGFPVKKPTNQRKCAEVHCIKFKLPLSYLRPPLRRRTMPQAVNESHRTKSKLKRRWASFGPNVIIFVCFFQPTNCIHSFLGSKHVVTMAAPHLVPPL
jgi:hypothetical protein